MLIFSFIIIGIRLPVKYDVVVIGGGILGLSVSMKLLEKRPGLRLLLLEKEAEVCAHQSGSNSGVIHSGIYYRTGSKKATNCRKGRTMLLEFIEKENIPYSLCGKIIAATRPEEIPLLDGLFQRGLNNGLQGLQMLSAEESLELEPNSGALRSIRVPETGIVDYRTVGRRFAEKIKRAGGVIKLSERLIGIAEKKAGLELLTDQSDYQASYCISCCGLQSDRIARLSIPDLELKIVPFRGEYYKLKEEKRLLVNGLIYPVPDQRFPFLGVHFTRRIDGSVDAGPNAVLAFKREGYKKSSFRFGDAVETLSYSGFLRLAGRFWAMGLGEFYRSYSKGAFTEALRRLVPSIQKDDLVPAASGIRAQALDPKGNLIDDFCIAETRRCFHLCNAPSPAATASLAIGDELSDRLILKMNQDKN